MAIDPVCKMEVDEDRGNGLEQVQKQNFYFCSPGCKKKFDEESGKSIAK